MRAFLLAVALLAPLQHVDDAVQRTVQAHRVAWLEAPMHAASDIGKPVVVVGALLGIAVLDAADGVAVARVALIAAAATNLGVEGLKRLIGRDRPDGSHNRSNSAFPSSHAANAFALAAVFARRWRRLAPAFWTAAVWVAASRVYLGRHWTTDVIGGAVLGLACAALAVRVLRWRPPRGGARPAPPVKAA